MTTYMNSTMSLRNVIYIFVYCAVLYSNAVQVNSYCRNYQRATDNLREVVIGRCEIYQSWINQDVFCPNENCTEIWEKFSSAFVYKPLCNVPVEGFDEFVRLTDHYLPIHKALLLENVYPFVKEYANNGLKYTALSNTLPGGPEDVVWYADNGKVQRQVAAKRSKFCKICFKKQGYIGDGPYWCSDPTTPDGMSPRGTVCPGWIPTEDCPQSAVFAFWVSISKRFAEKMEGHSYIMLNATVDPIYANDTYLAVHEVPYLRSGVVTEVTILLVNESPVKDKTKCDDPSIHLLEDQLAAMNIPARCMENRYDVKELLCLQDVSLGLCMSTATPLACAISVVLSVLVLFLFLL